MHGRARRCKAKQGRHGKTALTYESYLYSSTDFAPRTRGVGDLFGSTHLEVISPVRHESSLPAELMSASPVLQSFLLILAAVKPSAANRNCPCFSLSQPRVPLQSVPIRGWIFVFMLGSGGLAENGAGVELLRAARGHAWLRRTRGTSRVSEDGLAEWLRM
jgi:hypothetical protein